MTSKNTRKPDNLKTPRKPFDLKNTGYSENDFSKWKQKKSLEKGDEIGFEWVDLKDGKYREPEEDYRLVSDGWECVMVKRRLLLRYLSKDKRDRRDETSQTNESSSTND